MTQHNVSLASEIAELLGHIQFQDLVRQRIERIAESVTHGNEVLKQLPCSLGAPEPAMLELETQMRVVLENYLRNEARHAPACAAQSGQDLLPKFELF